MPRPKKIVPIEDMVATPVEEVDKLSELSGRVDKLVDIVEGLAERIIKNEEPAARLVEKFDLSPRPVVDPMPADDIPIPPSWLAKIHEILGADFEIKIVESAGGDFVMYVYLPDYLKRDKTIQGKDISTGLIRRPTAAQDVETWCIKIRDNIRKYYPDFKK